jgi:predicted TIM-barrel fold metal-dependent hydrolase
LARRLHQPRKFSNNVVIRAEHRWENAGIQIRTTPIWLPGEATFKMINAETQLMWSSDYPHWDFDLPSTIYDLPFLSEKAKHNILGGTAARLFNLPPRNEQQKANLKKFGNLAA